MIYLDNAATTYPKPESVYEAIDIAQREMAFNAGRGSYRVARETTKLIDETKQKLLKLVKAPAESVVVFTPSITIALNEILQGICFLEGDNVYVSPYEHNAVARTLNNIKKSKKINIIEMPLKEGTLEIDIEKLKYKFMQAQPKCVCCLHVSNVTGYILPVDDIFSLSKSYGAINVLDTAQSLGLVELNLNNEDIDFLAFAGHKTLYGPLGIGGFVDYGRCELNEFLTGGTGSDSLNLDMPLSSPSKYEMASTNVVAVAGLSAAIDSLQSQYEYEKQLLAYLIKQLKTVEGIVLYLPPENAHIGMVSMNIEGYKSEDIGFILDEDFDIAVRTGYHCAPYIHKWIKDERFLGTIRIGIGRFNTKSEIDCLIEALCEIVT